MLFELLRNCSKSFNLCKVSKLSSNCIHRNSMQAMKEKERKLHSSAHVLHKALNSVILHCCFAKDDEEMYQNVKHTFFYDALVVGCHSCVTSHVNATWTVTKWMPHEKIWAFFLPLVKLPSLLRWSFIHQNESFDRSSQRSTWIRRVSHPHYPCFLDQSLFD